MARGDDSPRFVVTGGGEPGRGDRTGRGHHPELGHEAAGACRPGAQHELGWPG